MSFLAFRPFLSVPFMASVLFKSAFLFFHSLSISIYDDLTLGTDLGVLPKTNTQISERVFNHNTSIFSSLKLGEIEISVFITT